MIDKTPFKSKKFIAFLVAMGVLAAILVAALLSQPITWPMSLFMGIGILAVGVVAIGYVLSQGAVDKFIQGVTGIAGAIKKPSSEEPKDGTDSDQPMGEV